MQAEYLLPVVVVLVVAVQYFCAQFPAPQWKYDIQLRLSSRKTYVYNGACIVPHIHVV